MNDIVTSYIRTTVPVIVGVLVTWLAARGVHLDEQTTAGLVAFLSGAISSLYYVLARLAEKYLSPKFGWMLGYAKMPVYTVKPKLPSDL